MQPVRNIGETVTRNAADRPFAERFALRQMHPCMRASDALRFLNMDTSERRKFAELRVGPRAGDGWEWCYLAPLDPAVWFAERPTEPYPLARMMILFPGFAPDPKSVRGQLVELAGGEVVRAGHPMASRLLRRPRRGGGE
ncbi:hypothetical protein [Thalassobaculum sp.]|uniref:hypothetical protein n=1 Tax=Thalassobaculum sp. TaxID=2022740 RepID=UPI0032F05F2D